MSGRSETQKASPQAPVSTAMRNIILALALLTAAVPASAQWRVTDEVDPMDDSRRVAAILMASNGGDGALVARCQDNETEAYISWQDYLEDGNTRVMMRFPPAEAFTERWSMSSDNTATFSRNPIDFLKRIANEKTMVARITPYREGPKTLMFDLGTEMGSVVSKIAEACGWVADGDPSDRERVATRLVGEQLANGGIATLPQTAPMERARPPQTAPVESAPVTPSRFVEVEPSVVALIRARDPIQLVRMRVAAREAKETIAYRDGNRIIAIAHPSGEIEFPER